MNVVAIIGGGITGVTLARSYAVCGYQVYLYEATEKFGGEIQKRSFPFALQSTRAQDYFMAFTPYAQTKNLRFAKGKSLDVPLVYHDWCAAVLRHKNIHPVRRFPITMWDMQVFLQHYAGALMYNTGRPDSVCGYALGVLPFNNGEPVRTPHNVLLHAQYVAYLEKHGVQCMGMSGLYLHFGVDDCINRAFDEVCQRTLIHPEHFITDEDVQDTIPLARYNGNGARKGIERM